MDACYEHRRRLAERLERGVPSADVAPDASLDHLEVCAECRSWLDEQTAVAAALGAIPLVDVPTGFAVRVRARLEQPASWFDAANWQRWSYGLLPVAAALILAAVWTSGETEPSPAVDLQPVLRSWASAEGRLPAWVERLLPEGELEAEAERDDLLVAVLTGRPGGEEAANER
jgi:hypothetical protein